VPVNCAQLTFSTRILCESHEGNYNPSRLSHTELSQTQSESQRIYNLQQKLKPRLKKLDWQIMILLGSVTHSPDRLHIPSLMVFYTWVLIPREELKTCQDIRSQNHAELVLSYRIMSLILRSGFISQVQTNQPCLYILRPSGVWSAGIGCPNGMVVSSLLRRREKGKYFLNVAFLCLKFKTGT
jgi:hypothetical protein